MAAATKLIRGIVRDSVTTEGIPYASLNVTGTKKNVLTDSRGIFELTVPDGAKALTVSTQGYQKKTIQLVPNSFNMYDIYLSPKATKLDELTVYKKKYTKKNNPAVDFARKLRDSESLTDPRRNDYYSYNRYERIALGISDFNPDSASALMRRFPFLVEHVDTSEISGQPVLNLSVGEKSSKNIYRKNPRSEKEIVEGRRTRGLSELSEEDNMSVIMEDIFREINLYDKDIALMRNRFVSPLSPLAPDFYRFYLTDTTMVDDVPCIVLAFYPRNKTYNGFTGHVYVEAADTNMFIRKVDLRTNPEINLNFVKGMVISQKFDKAPDGSRWKMDDQLILEASMLPGTPPVYISRRISYKNHSYDNPGMAEDFSKLGEVIVTDSAEVRDEAFWVEARSIPERKGERRIGQLTSRLRKVPLYYYGEKFMKIMFTGYVKTGNPSKFDYGPVNTTMSYNYLEGLRLRAGGMTTANLSPHWFGRGYLAYGIRDHRWKYSAELEYSFNRKKYHSREFPIHSIILKHEYDVDHLGSHYLYTSQDNFVLSWTRMSNRNDTYRRLTSLKYTLELNSNFSIEAAVENIRQESSPYLRFVSYDGRDYGHYTENSLTVSLRYAPGETFVQARSFRVPVNEDAPVFILSHKFAPKGFCGSKFAINKTEFNFSKRFWLSIAGSLDVMLGAGHVWSPSPFPDLLIPNANISYTIQPQSFALMNPMEFINSSYLSWDLTYKAHGLLFNLLPGIKKLGVREVVGFRGLWGHLSRKNMPSADNPELFVFPGGLSTGAMGHIPYMELSAGLDNIFRFLRVDYVWRLNYRNVPYDIDRSGVRIALHFTF